MIYGAVATFEENDHGTVAFSKTFEDTSVAILANFSSSSRTVTTPMAIEETVLSNYDHLGDGLPDIRESGSTHAVDLRPYEMVIVTLGTESKHQNDRNSAPGEGEEPGAVEGTSTNSTRTSDLDES